MFNDYFAKDSAYTDDIFRRRFRTRCSLFLKVVQDIQQHDDFFVQKRDAANKLGLSTIRKVSAAIFLLAYGVTADFLDEYLKMFGSTSLLCLKKICVAILMYSAKNIHVIQLNRIPSVSSKI